MPNPSTADWRNALETALAASSVTMAIRSIQGAESGDIIAAFDTSRLRRW